jgi:hypothetical protein
MTISEISKLKPRKNLLFVNKKKQKNFVTSVAEMPVLQTEHPSPID